MVAGHGWHQGVIGIVASRLARDYNRPAIVLTIQDGEAHGSGRSIGNLNLVKVLGSLSGLLCRFGGHPMAVGVGMREETIANFYVAMEECIRGELSADDLKMVTEYDGRVDFSELDDNFFSFLERLHPFGHKNSKPVFMFGGVRAMKCMQVGHKHCRGILVDKYNQSMDFIAFNRGIEEMKDAVLDVLATPQINDYYHEKRPQLQIVDSRMSF